MNSDRPRHKSSVVSLLINAKNVIRFQNNFFLHISLCHCRPYYLQGEYELVITEPEATNCFSINVQVNIMSLSRKFWVYL